MMADDAVLTDDDFQVCECLLDEADAVPMSLLDLFQHLRQSHGIDTDKINARIVLNIAGPKWTQTNIVWSINGMDIARQFNRWSKDG